MQAVIIVAASSYGAEVAATAGTDNNERGTKFWVTVAVIFGFTIFNFYNVLIKIKEFLSMFVL